MIVEAGFNAEEVVVVDDGFAGEFAAVDGVDFGGTAVWDPSVWRLLVL